MPNISWTKPTPGEEPWDADLGTVLDVFGNAINATVGTATPQPVAASGSAGTQTGPAAAIDHTHAGVPTSRAITAGTGLTGGGNLSADRTLTVAYGTSSTTAAVGNDSRLSDARTPTAHATTHQPGGSDAMAVDAAAATGSLRTLGTGSTQAAAGASVEQRGSDPWLKLHAGGDLDALIVGAITRDSNGAATSAGVVWPDGTTGTYTATTVSTAFPGAVDAYTVTYVGGTTKTVTQSTVTRDTTTGAVTNRPAMTVV